MTFVGKILVIVIMAFAILFLGISTVAFTTAQNWKQATAAEKKKVQELETKNGTLQAALEVAQKEKAQASADHKAAIDQSSAAVTSLKDEIAQLQQETKKAQADVESAIQRATVALNDAEARRNETDLLREQKREVEKQANEFKIQQTELNDQIRELKRQLQTVDDNNKNLRDRISRYSALLQRNGLSTDITTVSGLEVPPPVEGRVDRVDPSNRKVEISIGSDDGLAVGHELHMYRTFPRAEYLGKIKIQTVDPDRAVGRVIGNTINGKKIQEGDIVSSSFRPRS